MPSSLMGLCSHQNQFKSGGRWQSADHHRPPRL